MNKPDVSLMAVSSLLNSFYGYDLYTSAWCNFSNMYTITKNSAGGGGGPAWFLSFLSMWRVFVRSLFMARCKRKWKVHTRASGLSVSSELFIYIVFDLMMSSSPGFIIFNTCNIKNSWWMNRFHHQVLFECMCVCVCCQFQSNKDTLTLMMKQ